MSSIVANVAYNPDFYNLGGFDLVAPNHNSTLSKIKNILVTSVYKYIQGTNKFAVNENLINIRENQKLFLPTTSRVFLSY